MDRIIKFPTVRPQAGTGDRIESLAHFDQQAYPTDQRRNRRLLQLKNTARDFPGLPELSSLEVRDQWGEDRPGRGRCSTESAG